MVGKKCKEFRFTDGILLAALLLTGGFHEYISCALSAAMVVWLLLRLADSGTIRLKGGLCTWTVGVLCLGYGVTCLWAVDRGMAFLGFLKFLPLGLYLVCLWQTEEEGKVLQILPYFGAVMVAVSAIGMQIPRLSGSFSVDGRLAGFFQYPNTFAIFLLVCQLLLLKKERKGVWDYLTICLLVGGIFYSGSRTVLAVFLISNAFMIFLTVPKRARLSLLLLLAGLLLAGFLLALNENSVLNRYQILSIQHTSLVDRLLYILDSLSLLLKYPFGMGYMGYYYMQSSVQTGIYATTYVHNDFLQVFLDIGWVPGILLIAALIRWFCKKTVPVEKKVIVGALCFHALLDFDLQYIAIAMLLLLLTHEKGGQKQYSLKDTFLLKAGLTVAMTATLYMGAALLLTHSGQYFLADTLYPYNTRNMLTMLEQAESLDQANKLADRILQQNSQYFAPYSIKAKYSYAKGDFPKLIEYKNKVFDTNPFGRSEYQEYCEMLIVGLAYYEQAGDSDSVNTCRSELLATQAKLAENASRLSSLGKQLSVQPNMELSAEVRDFIAGMEGGGQ